ncbi:hypothetical protein F5B17DRAFT_334538 [Nemania serpens]|nr:hypothetical protein F5B17DRAFT_334538 [Nemania serpens]
MAQATLLLLPREIRDQIYHLVFAGSRLHVYVWGINGPHQFYAIGAVEILITCRTCYDEGRTAFWDEVLVYGGDQWARITVPQLSSYLDDLARSRIRHIRAVRGDPSSKISVAQFPRLETCEFFGRPLLANGFWYDVAFDDADDETWIEFATFGQFRRSKPQSLLGSWCETDAQTPKVKFLMTFPIYSVNCQKSNPLFPRRVYVNMTTGKYFIRDGTSSEETITEREEGLKRVLT